MLDPAPIVRACADAGVPWRVQCLAECDSTNALALQIITADSQLAEHGLVLFSEWQSAGRGRRGRPWHSEPGMDLLLSVAFQPSIEARRWGRYAHAAALAVVRALAPQFETSIKWPNDIYLGGRKLAGLLLESRASVDGDPGLVVIGIGLNVNTPPGAFPDNLDHPATSLCAGPGASPTSVDREPIAAQLVVELWQALRQAETDFPSLLAELSEYDLLSGRMIELTDVSGQRQRGLATGLGPEGELLFQPSEAAPGEPPLALASAESIRLI